MRRTVPKPAQVRVGNRRSAVRAPGGALQSGSAPSARPQPADLWARPEEGATRWQHRARPGAATEGLVTEGKAGASCISVKGEGGQEARSSRSRHQLPELGYRVTLPPTSGVWTKITHMHVSEMKVKAAKSRARKCCCRDGY